MMDVQPSPDCVALLEETLRYAVKQGASDIHFEPYQQTYRIRLRVDGLLQIYQELSTAAAPRLHSRIKMLAGMDIAEKRLPQDGRIQQEQTDIRVNSCPGLFGEKIVMRLLNTHQQLLPLESLGLSSAQLSQLQHAIQQPQGLILVTGPTGSGKSISLYSMLQALNQPERNVCSVEDPVEIQVPGINQVAINLKTDMTFERALRAFLRQDPDVIMVGEIRDVLTADIALKAAQTGHLVFSTLHTNSALKTLMRLQQMGLADYQLASAIRLIIAQRLVRKLCPHCKQPDIEAADRIAAELPDVSSKLRHCQIYQAKSCDRCYHGYKGRLGIFEVLKLSAGVRSAILNQATADTLESLAMQEGMIPLRRATLARVMQGVTSLEEANRVTWLGE